MPLCLSAAWPRPSVSASRPPTDSAPVRTSVSASSRLSGSLSGVPGGSSSLPGAPSRFPPGSPVRRNRSPGRLLRILVGSVSSGTVRDSVLLSFPSGETPESQSRCSFVAEVLGSSQESAVIIVVVVVIVVVIVVVVVVVIVVIVVVSSVWADCSIAGESSGWPGGWPTVPFLLLSSSAATPSFPLCSEPILSYS